MSEAEDTFEKIEFEKSALSGSSASGSDSDDLSSDHQQSTSEESASTMASSIDQVTSTQIKHLEFELPWSTRDEIIASLSQHTKLLSGLIIKEAAREKMRKANGDLMVALMNLPLKVDGRLRFQPREPGADEGPNEVALDLRWDVRSRIQEALTTNHNLALLEADSVSSECKAKLIATNNDLSTELLKLRSRTVAITGDSSASKGDHRIEQAAKASEPQTSSNTSNEEKSAEPSASQIASSPNQQVATSKELEKLKSWIKRQVAGEFSKQISGQVSAIGGFQGLKRKMDESLNTDSDANKMYDVDCLYVGTYRFLSRVFIQITDKCLVLNIYPVSIKIDFKLVKCLRYCISKIEKTDSSYTYIMIDFLQEAVDLINQHISSNADGSFRFKSFNSHEERFLMKLKHLPPIETHELKNKLLSHLPNQFNQDPSILILFETHRRYCLTMRTY